MEVQLLGPVEATDDGRPVALGAAKQRALLAILALRANHVVPAETLVDGLWPPDPPASAAKMVQHFVSRLRKVLPADAQIVTRGRGYELRIAPERVDAVRFARLVEDGAAREALALWHGAPLADLADEPFAAAEIRRLEELRRAALEDAIAADLAAGRHAEAIGTLTAALAEHPVSERLHAQLMLALYRAGRQTDALAAYRQARELLVEQAGVEPGPELRRLHAAILRQDPGLDSPSDALPPSRETVPCPFKGLAAYEVADAAWFFGRERLVAELAARLLESPVLALVGPSGSGKSSVLSAGLLAELARGVLPGSERWRHVLVRPGEHPERALRAAADTAGPPSILVVDQLEEAFTLCRDAGERAAFVERLVACAGDRARWSAVVLAIRADYYGRCAEHPPLARLVSANHVLIGPLGREDLRRAIELPAQQGGLELAPGLLDRLLDDARDVPGALPLVSSALVALWQRRDGRTLRLADYEAAGGLRGAVARLAEHAYRALAPPARDAARRVLLRLVGDDGQGRPVRRRVPLEEVRGDLLDSLAAARLVVVDAGRAELAHDALLREWPRLRGWLDEDVEGRRLHARLAQAAREWAEGGRDRGELYRGPRLAAALEWRATHPEEATPDETAFLDAAVAEGGRARRRLQIALATAVALLALTTTAALVAATQRGRARDEARSADAQRLGAQALTGGPLDRAVLYAREAVALDDTPATRANLLAALQRSPAALRVTVPIDGVPLTALALSPDATTLAAGDDAGRVRLLAGGGRRLGPRYAAGPNAFIASLAYSPDGRRLAVGGLNDDGGFAVELDPRTLRVAHAWPRQPGFVTAVRFSPDSRVLAAEVVQRPHQAQLVRWNAGNGGQLGPIVDVAGHDPALVALTGPDQALLSSAADRASTLREAGSGRALRRFPAAAPVTAATPSGRLVAFGSADGTVRLLDPATGRLRTLPRTHTGAITALAFSRDGRWLISAGRDARLVLWDARRGRALDDVGTDGSGTLAALAVAPDGRTAHSAGRDGRVTTWDLSDRRGFLRTFATGAVALVPGTLSVARRAPMFAAVDEQGAVDVFALRSLRLIRRLRGPGVSFDDAVLTPDGRMAAATTDDGWMWFWNVRTGTRRFAPQPAHGGAAWVVSVDGRGRWLASGGVDDIVRVWDARRGLSVKTALTGSAGDVSLSPDGRTLATTFGFRNFDGGLQLRSVPGLRPLRTLPLPAGTIGQFSPDGRTLVYGDQRGQVWVVDTRDWRVHGRPLSAGASRIVGIATSPDGRSIAVTSADGTGTLWDLTSRRPLNAPLPGGPDDVVGAAFVDGGARLLVLRRLGGAVWDPRLRSWLQRACALAGRPLTRAEWRRALAGRPYAPAC